VEESTVSPLNMGQPIMLKLASWPSCPQKLLQTYHDCTVDFMSCSQIYFHLKFLTQKLVCWPIRKSWYFYYLQQTVTNINKTFNSNSIWSSCKRQWKEGKYKTNTICMYLFGNADKCPKVIKDGKIL